MKITRADYGCGDNSCFFGSPGGMATNGGCHCFELFPRTAEGREAARRIKRGVSVLRNEVDDWRESARKAIEEPCGDEKHCSCVGPMRHQLVRQAQRVVEADEEIAALEKIAKLAVSLAEQFERAVESRRPVSGMSVPPSGDFIACAQLPSAVARMRWWAREIRRAQTQWSEVGE